MKKRALIILALFLLLVLGWPQTHAALLTLSTHCNDDGGHPADPALLDATLGFSVVGSQLTLAVTNLTPENPEDPALNINQVYFSATGNVQGLVLVDVDGANKDQWALSFAEDGFLVGGFGEFDVSLVDGTGDVSHVIGPGDTVTFIIDIIGTGPFEDIDFTTEFSTVFDEDEAHVPSLAAAKFYNCENPGISGYGATNIPEPATIMLLGLGAFGLFCRRRK